MKQNYMLNPLIFVISHCRSLSKQQVKQRHYSAMMLYLE